ncbi:hypothetical protein FHT76_008434 [Rhizobium sp. BK176]|nr:hypothetical protein [Rhizobium sp. BK661]MCS4096711.1 hypothetical protein [Rhizobium sp. BK176]
MIRIRHDGNAYFKSDRDAFAYSLEGKWVQAEGCKDGL